jgi:tetratricopeptide (TPR) repeat protein
VSRRREWGVPLAVFAASAAAFLPVLRNGFINWDDDALIASNPAAAGLGWFQVKWAFSRYVIMNYAPLTWLSYGVDRHFWGLDPRGYHLTNLLLHAANAALLYLAAKRLIAAAHPQRSESVRPAAVVSALVFALHPLRVESVAWAAERRDVLCGFFYLLTILLYLREEIAASVLAFAASLLSKGIGITLPAALVIIDVYPLRRAISRELLVQKAPYAVLAAAAAVIGIKGQAVTSVADHGLAARLTQTFYGFFFYLWKTLFPFRLSPIYELPRPFHPLEFPYLEGACAAAALSALLWLRRKEWPAAAAAWAFYVVTVLPVSGIAQFGLQLAADRYSYLPTLSFAVLAGGAFASLRDRARAPGRPPWLLPGACAVIVCLAVLTWRQARFWRDSATLWSYALPLAPESSSAHSGMADALRDAGRVDEAVEHYRKALSINPDRSRTQNNYGMALAARGELDEAIKHYRLALELWPDGDVIHDNLGLAFVRQRRLAEAEAEFRRAVAINPGYAEAHGNLGGVLALTGRLPEAIERYREGARLSPDDVNIACSLGLALAKQGRWEEADEIFRKALSRSPDSAGLYRRVRAALQAQGGDERALDSFGARVRSGEGP